MTGEYLDLGGSVLRDCVVSESMNFVEKEIGIGDSMVVERENLDE